MIEVGDYLRDKALRDEADPFGRSAFNRYYYATYLSIRELLRELNPDWGHVSHKDIPTLLEGKVVNPIKRAARRQRDMAAIHGAYAAAAEIANVLRTAYAVRIVADYEPEDAIIFHDGTFTLSNHGVGEAASWVGRVAAPKQKLRRLYRELGIV
jgi:hypothetical protein